MYVLCCVLDEPTGYNSLQQLSEQFLRYHFDVLRTSGCSAIKKSPMGICCVADDEFHTVQSTRHRF